MCALVLDDLNTLLLSSETAWNQWVVASFFLWARKEPPKSTPHPAQEGGLGHAKPEQRPRSWASFCFLHNGQGQVGKECAGWQDSLWACGLGFLVEIIVQALLHPLLSPQLPFPSSVCHRQPKNHHWGIRSLPPPPCLLFFILPLKGAWGHVREQALPTREFLAKKQRRNQSQWQARTKVLEASEWTGPLGSLG